MIFTRLWVASVWLCTLNQNKTKAKKKIKKEIEK